MAPVEARERGGDEILVMARKREESILNVPVIAQVLTQQRLETFQTTGVNDLPSLVPGVTIGHAQGPLGTLVSIRGVGTISADQGVDASVSLNIDGLSLGSGLAFSSGLFDLGQIEVLKGPQALFYGKSSPGGVISLRTADPTDEFELILRGSYEFEARGTREELIVSGPVSDTLKLRLAGMYSSADGYFRNIGVAAPGTGAMTPTNRREVDATNYIVRGTALWTPSSNFTARLKVNFVRDVEAGQDTAQMISCPQGTSFAPSGIPFIGGDCKLDRNISRVYLDPVNFPGLRHNGMPLLKREQKYGTLELNYNASDSLTFNSTTAFYKLTQLATFNGTNSTRAGPAIGLDIEFNRRNVTQEFRVDSDYSSPLNFMAGAFFEDGVIGTTPNIIGNSAYGLRRSLSYGRTVVDIRTYSLFGQLRWQVSPGLELSGGLRWTDETRRDRVTNLISGTPTPVTLAVPRIHSSNFAPELTITYKPNDDTTLFASYKKAYKSGSFSMGSVAAPGANTSFGDEKVEGGEIGLKSQMFDRQLLINLAGYYYDFRGLQVGGIEPAENGVPATRTLNAGQARTYGVDLEVGYNPDSIEGLALRGSANWNHARYIVLDNTPCWGGQTIALGCTEFLNPVTGLFTAQNLSGTPMVRAPAWQLNFGFDYELPIGRGMSVAFSNSNAYSSRYRTQLAVGRRPDEVNQEAVFTIDASLSLRGPEERWELSLIGKNLTDKITAPNCNVSNYANGGVFGGQITGGTTSGPAGIGQVGCNTQPGREVWVRATTRF